jgi:hypothetical protein
MHIKENGIILRHFPPSYQKLAVLTQTVGKIILVVLNHRQIQQAHDGSLIEATLMHQRDALYTTVDLEVINTPLPKVPEDIYWLHHLLELSYFFLPLHDQTYEHFFILSSCLIFIKNNIHHYEGWHSLKHFCIGMFLMYVGFNPPEYLKIPLKKFADTLFSFIDFDETQKVESIALHLDNLSAVSLSELDAWLIACIQSHPRINMFKTLSFMYQTSLART